MSSVLIFLETVTSMTEPQILETLAEELNNGSLESLRDTVKVILLACDYNHKNGKWGWLI